MNELLRADKCLNFDEMIRRALGYLRQNPGLLSYRFILVDEFQDTAPGRGDMIRKMLSARPDSLLFAVGDDWQAINRFAGSDLRFFREFGAAFNRRAGASKQCELTQTFRSNQGIADVARTFVLRNASQMPKTVDAYDRTRDSAIDVRMYRSDRELVDLVDGILANWVARHPQGSKPSVFILGRYGKRHAGGLTAEQISKLDQKWEERIEFIKTKDLYATMHTSKGLQADYVLVVGMYRAEQDFFCFPSEREDDPLLQLVLPPKEAMADADERRLFYAALTRAKYQVVLLAHHASPRRTLSNCCKRIGTGLCSSKERENCHRTVRNATMVWYSDNTIPESDSGFMRVATAGAAGRPGPPGHRSRCSFGCRVDIKQSGRVAPKLP